MWWEPFENSKHFGFVIPDDKRFGSDIFIAKDNMNGARNGMKVLVEIINWPEKTRSAEGKNCATDWLQGRAGCGYFSIILGHDLPQSFPVEVLESAEAIRKNSGCGNQKRRDLRKCR